MLDGRIVDMASLGTAAAAGDDPSAAITTVELPPGSVVLPAFVDEHVHIFAALAARTSVDLSAARSLAEVLDLLRVAADAARRHPTGSGAVRAWGIDEFDLAERRLPSVAELDAAGGDVPLVVHHRTGHAVITTTRTALAPAGDGRRDPTGARWRVLAEEAERLSRELAGLGVVELCDTSDGNGAEDLRALAELGLTQRLRAMVGIDAVSAPNAVSAANAVSAPNAVSAVGGVWSAAADTGIDIEAVKVMPPRCGLDRVADVIRRAHAAGFAAAVHAVDIDELQAALDGGLRPGDRVEHAGLCLPEQVARLAASGAMVVTQPTFVTRRAHKYRAALSTVEQAWLYRVRSLLDAGVAVRFSSDAPVVPPGPLEQVAAAATRRLGPHERVDVATALASVCRPAAVGDPADLVVLAADPFDVEQAAVAGIGVVATWRAGELIHGDPRRWPSAPPPGARR
ncbi:MAG: amidohydrolase family protein [Acidimicrobiales bacterium]|nr:amidohydrolase family protein [Acidimicrobiales bacterium]